MKKMIVAMSFAAALVATAMEYSTVALGDKPVRMPFDAKAISLDVVSTKANASVTAKVVRAVSSYTNCVKVAVVTNGIGEVSTVTNRWMGLKETKTYTNAIGSATCSGGVASADVGKFVLGGDLVFAEGVTNVGDAVNARLVIER